MVHCLAPKKRSNNESPGQWIGRAGRRRCGWSIFGQARRCAVREAADDRRPAKPDGGGLPDARWKLSIRAGRRSGTVKLLANVPDLLGFLWLPPPARGGDRKNPAEYQSTRRGGDHNSTYFPVVGVLAADFPASALSFVP